MAAAKQDAVGNDTIQTEPQQTQEEQEIKQEIAQQEVERNSQELEGFQQHDQGLVQPDMVPAHLGQKIRVNVTVIIEGKEMAPRLLITAHPEAFYMSLVEECRKGCQRNN